MQILTEQNQTRIIRGYCAQCSSLCPTVAHVRDGIFVKVKPDWEHPNAAALCPKGLAGPELVYNKQRLQYPMRRTRPKDDPDPGWERITWDEALDIVAARLNQIKAEWGAEAVAFARCGPGGSPMTEIQGWMVRLAHAFGTPNIITTGHICQWHRDSCSAYTYGKPGTRGTLGQADFEKSSCILIWGVNPHATSRTHLRDINRGLKQGAKLIVVDPRKTQLARVADIWLQVQPGTDGALVLGMLNVIIEEDLYDYSFVRDWTTAPFLVRSDNGNLLKASDLIYGSDPSSYVVIDAKSGTPSAYIPGSISPMEPALDSAPRLRLTDGKEIECRTAFRLLHELVANYSPETVEASTGVPRDKIRDAARMFATTKPSCLYSYNGIEQNINASQTNRALCILYALTGSYDAPGGNVILPTVPVNRIEGREFLTPEAQRKRLGSQKRPLGPAGMSSTQAYEVYEAIMTQKPYPIKGLVGFGGNIVMSNAPSSVAREAITQLDFHVQCELFLSPTAALADIVLPSASFWESWHVGTSFRSTRANTHIQLRPAVVPPRHECLPDLEIIFQLASKLGLSDKFWNGDIKAAFNYQLAPSNITVEQLEMNPGGISLNLPVVYKKYSEQESTRKFVGFNTPSKRIEIYSQTFNDHGYNPLPAWEGPITGHLAKGDSEERYPLILTNAKILQYCHSQHRALPSLRKVVPYPFLEINPVKAREIACDNGEYLILETAYGSITVRAKVTNSVAYNVVCAQHGWWQGCPELNLPGLDPYSSEGANVNLLYQTKEIDPISGSVPIKGCRCNVRKSRGIDNHLDGM